MLRGLATGRIHVVEINRDIWKPNRTKRQSSAFCLLTANIISWRLGCLLTIDSDLLPGRRPSMRSPDFLLCTCQYYDDARGFCYLNIKKSPLGAEQSLTESFFWRWYAMCKGPLGSAWHTFRQSESACRVTAVCERVGSRPSEDSPTGFFLVPSQKHCWQSLKTSLGSGWQQLFFHYVTQMP